MKNDEVIYHTILENGEIPVKAMTNTYLRAFCFIRNADLVSIEPLLEEDSRLDLFIFLTGGNISINYNIINSNTNFNIILVNNTRHKSISKIEISGNIIAKNVANKISACLIAQDGSSQKILFSIKAEKGAINSNIHENIVGYNVSSKSEIVAVPSLEIEENDINCSHKVAIGALNEEELFYLQSRGLDRARSIKLILDSQLKRHIDEIGNNEFKKNVEIALLGGNYE